MKTLLAIFVGAATAAAFAFVAMWIMSGFTATPTLTSALHGGPGTSLMITGLALVIGAFVAVKVHPSGETLSGYATVQLCFGPALSREFWLGAAAPHVLRCATRRTGMDGQQTRVAVMLFLCQPEVV